jgi:hypothetical protein
MSVSVINKHGQEVLFMGVATGIFEIMESGDLGSQQPGALPRV